MTSVRAWQTVERIDGGGTRVATCLELDLAHSPATRSLELRYVPFRSRQANRAMFDFAQHLVHFGPQSPALRSVLLLRKSETPDHFDARYPGVARPTYKGATIVSANVAEAAIVLEAVKEADLQMTGAEPVWSGTTLGAAHGSIIENLWREGRLLYVPAERSDLRLRNPRSTHVDLLMPFNPGAGYLSTEASTHGALAAFTAGFFITWDDEFDDPYSFAKDPVGLVLVRGRVVNAPLFRRTALLFSNRNRSILEDDTLYSLHATRPLIKSVSLENYAVKLPHDVCVLGSLFREQHIAMSFGRRARAVIGAELNPLKPRTDGAAFFTRLVGLRSGAVTSCYTPPATGRVELTIAGEEICSVHEGGQTFIPRNAFVLSLPASPLADRVVSEVIDGRTHLIEQGVDLGDDALAPSFGVQVGPQLIRRGRCLDVGESLRRGEEEYVAAEEATEEPGIPPVKLAAESLLSGKIARLGFGMRPDRRCFTVLLEGCEERSYVQGFDSVGGTTEDLTRHLLDLGCSDAVALDGGGSAQIICRGQSATRVADRHDIPLMPFERVLPGGWMVHDLPSCEATEGSQDR